MHHTIAVAAPNTGCDASIHNARTTIRSTNQRLPVDTSAKDKRSRTDITHPLRVLRRKIFDNRATRDDEEPIRGRMHQVVGATICLIHHHRSRVCSTIGHESLHH